MLGDIGWQELVLTLAILALIFGGSRVADIGGSLGRGIREFRKEMKDDEPTAKKADDTADAAPPVEAASKQDQSH